MPITIIERFLRFRFDDTWAVIKYDDHSDYVERIQHLPETKGVDFVAVLDERFLYFIEVKDFRGHRIENRARVKDGDLAIEVAQKVRDTIAGIVAAHHRGSTEEWSRFIECLTNSVNPVRVLLWLEDDLPSGPRGRRHNQASVMTDRLKQHLSWLTPRVFVVGLTVGAAPNGLTVTNLPGAGRSI
jgi:hypothetical protein